MQRRGGKCESDKLVRAIGLLLAWQNLRCACCMPLAQARLLGANGQGVHFRLAYLPIVLASIFSRWHMDTQRPFCQPPALLTSCMPTCERLTPQAPAGGLHDVKDAAGCAIGEQVLCKGHQRQANPLRHLSSQLSQIFQASEMQTLCRRMFTLPS